MNAPAPFRIALATALVSLASLQSPAVAQTGSLRSPAERKDQAGRTEQLAERSAQLAARTETAVATADALHAKIADAKAEKIAKELAATQATAAK